MLQTEQAVMSFLCSMCTTVYYLSLQTTENITLNIFLCMLHHTQPHYMLECVCTVSFSDLVCAHRPAD